jgi:hypothetical protein
MKYAQSRIAAVATYLVFSCIPMALFAQEDTPDAAAMAKKLANPTAAVASLTSNFDFTEYGGNLPDANNQRG